MEIHNTYVFSDTHFKHKNLVTGTSKWEDKTQCRNFQTTDEHDETIITNWNNKLSNDDTMIFLGDFTFGRSYLDAEHIMRRLNFQTMHYIFGNHDGAMQNFFQKYGDLAHFENKTIVNHGGYFEYDFELPYKQSQFFAFCHYPMVRWNKSHRGAIHCFGHEHNHLNGWLHKHMPNNKLIDMGPENTNFTPLSIREIMELMVNKLPTDHH